MAALASFLQGESITIGFALPIDYDLARIEEIKVYLGTKLFEHTITDNIIKCQIKSVDTKVLLGNYNINFWLDDSTFGVKKQSIGDVNFNVTGATATNTSVNNGFNILANLSIEEETITVENIFYNYFKGEQGDKLTFEDLTQEDKDALKGQTGTTAYEYAVLGGYEGTEEEFTTWLNKTTTLYDEIPSGLVNGINTEFALSHIPISKDYIFVSLNGVNRNDFTFLNNKVVFSFAPTSGSVINVKYFSYLSLYPYKKENGDYFSIDGFAASDGNFTPMSAFIRTDYITLLEVEKITVKGGYANDLVSLIAFYDKDKFFISRVTDWENYGDEFTLLKEDFPTDAVYAVFSSEKALNPYVVLLDDYIISKGFRTLQEHIFDWNVTQVQLNLPAKIYCVVGNELNVYYDNIIDDNSRPYEFRVTCSIGKSENDRFTVTPSSAGTFTLLIEVYLFDRLLTSKTTSLIVKAANVGSGLTKKLIIIGDSITDIPTTVTELNNIFSGDAMALELIGTRGTPPNVHEGRSGWTTNLYNTVVSFGGVANAFYNVGFDFAYYLSETGFDEPNHVIINLGINDIFSFKNDGLLLAEIENILARYETMIASIHDVNIAIKVGIALTIPPAFYQDGFGASYGNLFTRTRYKRNNYLWLKSMIENFASRENENVFLVPLHCNLDTKNNMQTVSVAVNSRNTNEVSRQSDGVHPAQSGFEQIADSYYYYLKSFEN